MPHRPEGQGPSSLSPGGVVTSSVYTPPRVTGSTAAAIMRQQTSDSMGSVSQDPKPTSPGMQYGTHHTHSLSHSTGVVTPVVKNKGGLTWLTASASNKSTDSTDRSDDSRSIATLATEDEREATASALLMVAKSGEREHRQHYFKGMVVDSSSDNRPSGVMPSVSSLTSTSSASSVPLKKRKKTLDILRRQRYQINPGKEACNVSPVSHDGNHPSSASNRAQSYDSKDVGSTSLSSSKGETTKELLDSAKVHSTAQIGAGATLPLAQVRISHFPTVLHRVLADKEFTTVIRWLPDGEAWKVENWNAMRRKVLPKHFSDLRDETGSSCGTIDAFLHSIDAWGFEEIKSGSNAGAYRHNLFIRGAQRLCVKMRLDVDNTATKKGPKTISPGNSATVETGRMMLQVPILATADSKNQQQSMPPNKRPRFESNGMGLSGHGPLHWPYANEPASGMMWGSGTQFNSHSDISHARAYGMRAALAMNGNNPYASQNGSYNIDPRMQLLRVPTSDSMTMPRQQPPFQYNPPQVRSGRGALRGIASATHQNRASMSSSPSTTPSFRQGLTVSNRGKGSRKSAACRTVLPSSNEVKHENNNTSKSSSDTQHSMVGDLSLSEAERIGNSVKGVAVAISRKTKRKLPKAADRKAA